eukprot:5109344-Amphidinium_carterae.1
MQSRHESTILIQLTLQHSVLEILVVLFQLLGSCCVLWSQVAVHKISDCPRGIFVTGPLTSHPLYGMYWSRGSVRGRPKSAAQL